MADRCVQNRLRHQRCPGVVEMQAFGFGSEIIDLSFSFVLLFL
jgi:hypothetical protein